MCNRTSWCFNHFNSTNVTGFTTLIHYFRLLHNVNSALSGHLTTATRINICEILRHWFNCASETSVHPRLFHSLPYGRSLLVDFARRNTGTAFEALRHLGDTDMDPYFEASYAKLGTSSCKKCKEKIEKGALRLAKVRY